MIDHPNIGKLEYSKITKYIYIGTNACCKTHFDKKLLKKGIEVDISLEKEKVDTPYGIKYFLWLPTKDHTAPTQNQLTTGVLFLDLMVNMKKKVYVHCQNGHGRAPTMVAAYFIKNGKSVDEAVDFINTKRPTIHLEKVQKQSLIEFSKNITH